MILVGLFDPDRENRYPLQAGETFERQNPLLADPVAWKKEEVPLHLRPALGILLLLYVTLWSGCVRPPVAPVIPEPPPACPPPVVPEPPPVTVEPPPVTVEPLQAVPWAEIVGWAETDPLPAFEVFVKGCRAVRKKPQWAEVCAQAETVNPADVAQVRTFLEENFIPHRVANPDGEVEGLVTGYYAPDLKGSRNPSGRYRYPLFGVPDDLLVIDLRSVYPELGNYRLRGRLEGRRVVPYWSRAEIDAGKGELAEKALFWVADPVELFFLQVQGSGRINLDSGETVMVGYADQNGYPYRSIGKILLERGEMSRDQMSMQNIRAWARSHPDLVAQLLGENPSYVFFHELSPEIQTPPGALGLSLTPGYSLAVDPRYVPLGAPVFLSTTWPSRAEPLQRLMVAQDTGGAIKGPVRADFFWGMGESAGELAGRMKQKAKMWVFLPREEASAAETPAAPSVSPAVEASKVTDPVAGAGPGDRSAAETAAPVAATPLPAAASTQAESATTEATEASASTLADTVQPEPAETVKAP